MSRNFFFLIILSAIWGSAFFAIKISVETIDPVSVASGRLIIASIFLYIYYKFKKLTFEPSIKIILFIILIGILGNFIPFFLISWSEKFIQSNTAGLLMSVGPIFALILSHFMTKDDKFSFNKLLAVTIGFIGVLFILDFNTFFGFFSNSNSLIIPKLVVILAVLGYVVSSIIAYNIKTINSVTLTTFVTISAAIISIPFLFFIEISNDSSPSIKSLLSLIYLGLFPTAIAFLIRFYLVLKAGPTFLSYVSYLIPGFAIIWGYFFLNEKISYSSILGLIFVLIGIYLSQKYSSVSNNS